MSSLSAQVLEFPKDQSMNTEADSGYIKLHRKLEDESWARCPVKRVIWEHLLLNATHKPYRTRLGSADVILQPGQLISGRNKILNECFDQRLLEVTPDMVRGALNFFKKQGMVSAKSTRQGTIFTIVKWDVYQGEKGQKSPQHNPQANPQAKASSYAGSSEDLPKKNPKTAPTKQESKTLNSVTDVTLGASDDTPTPKKKPNKTFIYPDEFEWIWKNKPPRQGGDDKRKAFYACRARIKQGATWRDLAEGLQRYRKYCEQTDKFDTEFVKQMATFFGPGDHFNQEWKVNHAANQQTPTGQARKLSTVDRQHAAAAEYLARLESEHGGASDADSVVASHE